MPRYTVRVEEGFDAAHFLKDYEGACARMHGHHWRIGVFVSGDALNRSHLLVDFADLKAVLREELAPLDHHCLNEVPPFGELSPTSENLAAYLYGRLRERLAAYEGLRLEQVSVSESPQSEVIYREDG